MGSGGGKGVATITELLEQYRFMITIGFGGVVVIILAVYVLLTTTKKKATQKAKKQRAARKAGEASDIIGGDVDSLGMPLDDDDDGEYRDSDLYGGKRKKGSKEEYFKDWD